jgi:hypothetical protein
MKTLRKNYPKEYWTILNTGKSGEWQKDDGEEGEILEV